MMRERFNNGVTLPQPPMNAPQCRNNPVQHSADSHRPAYNATKTLKSVLHEPGYWIVERLLDGDWLSVGAIVKKRGGRYQVVGQSTLHLCIKDALEEAESVL